MVFQYRRLWPRHFAPLVARRCFGFNRVGELGADASDVTAVSEYKSAIPHDAPSDRVHNRPNLVGICKWTVDAEKCFGFWVGRNSDCSICIRVCPYNKDFSKWWARLDRWLAGTTFRSWMGHLDVWLGFGARHASSRWWASGGAPRKRHVRR